ncbi:MAG: T9SS type A sorting domain-containing protein [Bacteroidia bacterium]
MKNSIYILLFIVTSFFFQASAQTISANWKLTGPVKFPTNKSGQINGIGRVSQIVFHPSNPSKMYAASASGGLYISTDGAQNWTVTGTDRLPDMGCASVCVDYKNDQIIYLGSGDANYYSNSYGIWKTVDGGKTWKQSNSGIGNRMALRILMSANNSKILIAATNDGIWKSIDAGVTWVLKKPGGDFKDMEFKPGSSQMMYAVTSSEFFYSTDLGETWTKTTLPATNTNGGRVGISKADTNVVYVTFVGDFASGKTTPVYKSVNSGISFTTVKPANKFNLNGYTETENGQGNYNYTLTVDPLDINNVWVAGHCVFNSRDGGVTWKRITTWAYDLHTDIHQLIYSPFDSKNFFCSNDGGVWKNTDAGVGAKWAPISDGLGCTEYYHAGQSPIMKERVGGGTQDNGETYYDLGNWYTNRGGDYDATTTFDYLSADNVYYPSAGKKRIGITGNDKSLAFPFTPSKTTLLKFTSLKKNTAFLASSDVWRTDNLATVPPTWTQISTFNEQVKAMCISPNNINIIYVVASSGNIYRSDDALSTSASFTKVGTCPSSISSKAAITGVKSSPEIVYLSCNSKVYRSTDKGVSWINISTGLPATNFIEIHSDIYSNDESVYIANGASAIYYKNSKLNAWVNYSQGLPTICNINDFMIFNDGDYKNSVLRVAYYGRGVWQTPLYNIITVVDEHNSLITFEIYPNPTSTGVFTISTKGYQQIKIYNITGEMIMNIVPTTINSQIDMKQYSKGMYIIKGISDKGTVTSKKIMIQ